MRRKRCNWFLYWVFIIPKI